ncbi:exopolysaccharide production repressor protein [Agrobacterium tumefaciens]|uniref:exopolysaccharide production repressor protein n=1 Tax=Agrobacterium tumefaciens TaxID=358 RepID=UPI00287C61C3|nr:exopolysaccharide production repressor protein [Agrobacterium tumefaciens]MDS7595079.1 exopolysaccharide production repressor protein [Agrobacterium tumefaciens]
MYAPRVFISMIGALLVFAIATYFIQGSFYTAFIQTLIAAVILQVGYFIAILFLVGREKRQLHDAALFQRERTAENPGQDSIKGVPHSGAKLTDM